MGVFATFCDTFESRRTGMVISTATVSGNVFPGFVFRFEIIMRLVGEITRKAGVEKK